MKSEGVRTAVTAILFTMSLRPITASENNTIKFLENMHMVRISLSTIKLIEELELHVFNQASGDRNMSRYFEKYDTPFVAKKMDKRPSLLNRF
ncbi:hypothetical protein evm_007235 [Chilo suppressalis]|nr:hypothetical protein evm_007235 [Chilo suppressalis]